MSCAPFRLLRPDSVEPQAKRFRGFGESPRQQQGEYVPHSLSDKRVKLIDAAAEPLADVVEGVCACTRYARRPERG